ncbi:hypothetical protein CDD83_9799 [Cordyceps sp. RAO-2017]|nr:hypothetical protein CDD83_9799 [Cordyceps sp. RAO-2017]
MFLAVLLLIPAVMGAAAGAGQNCRAADDGEEDIPMTECRAGEVSDDFATIPQARCPDDQTCIIPNRDNVPKVGIYLRTHSGDLFIKKYLPEHGELHNDDP